MIISIASGKGGTGKTTVAVGMALSAGYCQFMDYDVEAPNASFFLKPEIQHIKKVYMKQPYFLTGTGADFHKCADFCHYNAIAVVKGKPVFFSELCHGCGGCLLVGPSGAVRENDVNIGEVRKGFSKPGIDFVMGNLNPGFMRTVSIQAELDREIEDRELVIIDCPPGTSYPMVFSVKSSDYCILVTEPTPYGLNDLELSIEVLKTLKIPFGVIINRDGIGTDEIEKFCKDSRIKIFTRISNDIEIARFYSNGKTILDYDSKWSAIFKTMIKDIEMEIK